MNDNIDYDTFVRNPPNPVDFSDIFNDLLSDTLFSSSSSTSPIPNSFNISSFNVNGLKTPGQGSFKMDQISSFFLQNHISFGSIVDTHLSPKQMKFLSKRVCDYTIWADPWNLIFLHKNNFIKANINYHLYKNNKFILDNAKKTN
ncbi:hypothetical protein RIR_jg13812.t1 [Rhizophagus irregularis DAOM 181602=DAOM 197198]|nr:hypothetical protein RIR_jg13812.t1 [Rhizophagus irregularis DAOM 181602=DAOM 197198]